MIVIKHDGKNVVSASASDIVISPPGRITDFLFTVAEKYPSEIIVWCHRDYAEHLNFDAIPDLFIHQKTLISYSAGDTHLSESIGYVDESSFIKFNRDVRFPTWRMSAHCGAVHAVVLNAVNKSQFKGDSFGYFLTSLAKLSMPLGLRCFSEPRLLRSRPDKPAASDQIDIFSFVAKHYKRVWIGLLLLNLIIYERRFPLFAAISALFDKRRKLNSTTFDNIPTATSAELPLAPAVDVIIPTIGREKYLLDFLIDLRSQTLLPKMVIVVEQNPETGSVSQLDYLHDREWPFEIRHIFIHQSGVCNARNLALREVANDWIFLADDDIRIESIFLQNIFKQIGRSNEQVYNICCLREGQQSEETTVHQTSIFGSGCSIISRKSLGNTTFDTAFEFGFGEDGDFGSALMNKGFCIEYLPKPAILHLKAPVGGFRIKPKHAWDDEILQPKPSPTVLLYKMKHHTKQQILGYKTMLFFKFYSKQSVKNPFAYIKLMNKRWERSRFWATHLQNKPAS